MDLYSIGVDHNGGRTKLLAVGMTPQQVIHIMQRILDSRNALGANPERTQQAEQSGNTSARNTIQG